MKTPISELGKIAQDTADNLICRHGLKSARIIGKLVNQKIKAVYDRMEEKYGKIEW